MQTTFLKVKQALKLVPQVPKYCLGELYKPKREWENEKEQDEDEDEDDNEITSQFQDANLDQAENLLKQCQKYYPYCLKASFSADDELVLIRRKLEQHKHKLPKPPTSASKEKYFKAYNRDDPSDITDSEKVDDKNKEFRYLPENNYTLLSMCVESTYGDLKEHKTKIDRKVRCAFEIPGKDVCLTDFCKKILDSLNPIVSASMFGGKPIRFEINKLNVYPPGGFFSRHVDTPGKDVMGTLVIQLPGNFNDGQLVIECPERGQEASFESSYQTQIIAMYGNCPHEILPVCDGFRKSVSLYIMSDAKNSKKIKVAPKHSWMDSFEIARYKNVSIERYYTEQPSDLGTTVAFSALEDCLKKYYQEAKTVKSLGFLLNHKYSNDEYKNGNLKGADSQVFALYNDLANKHRLKLTLLPVLIYHSEHGYMPEDSPVASEFFQRVYKFSSAEIEQVGSLDMDAEKEVASAPAIPFLGATNWVELESDKTSYCETTGNECQPGEIDNYYFSNAVILEPTEEKEAPKKAKGRPKAKAKSKSKSKRTEPMDEDDDNM